MAAGNPCICTDAFGEEYTFWTDALDVYFSTNLRPDPIWAFEQLVEDGPIAANIDDMGRIAVTYLDEDGNRLTTYSDQDGDEGTWL